MVMKFPIAKKEALSTENMATRPIATSARPMRPDASPGGLVPSLKCAIQVAEPEAISARTLADFIRDLNEYEQGNQGRGRPVTKVPAYLDLASDDHGKFTYWSRVSKQMLPYIFR